MWMTEFGESGLKVPMSSCRISLSKNPSCTWDSGRGIPGLRILNDPFGFVWNIFPADPPSTTLLMWYVCTIGSKGLFWQLVEASVSYGSHRNGSLEIINDKLLLWLLWCPCLVQSRCVVAEWFGPESSLGRNRYEKLSIRCPQLLKPSGGSSWRCIYGRAGVTVKGKNVTEGGDSLFKGFVWRQAGTEKSFLPHSRW